MSKIYISNYTNKLLGGCANYIFNFEPLYFFKQNFARVLKSTVPCLTAISNKTQCNQQSSPYFVCCWTMNYTVKYQLTWVEIWNAIIVVSRHSSIDSRIIVASVIPESSKQDQQKDLKSQRETGEGWSRTVYHLVYSFQSVARVLHTSLL